MATDQRSSSVQQQSSEQQQPHGSLPHATVSDMAHLQRAVTQSMVPVRSLGRGAFAAVELVSMPVAGKRKLLVCKKLLPQSAAPEQQQQSMPSTESSQQAADTPQQQSCQQLGDKQLQSSEQQSQQQQQQAEPPLKPSSHQDWSREVSMHREAAGCPFVLQLLAAKKCRAGNMLLLTEYASAGSLTDVLARMQLKPKHKGAVTAPEQEQKPSQQPLQEAATEGAAAALQDAESSVLCAANSDSVAALCDALREGHAPTAMLIHGVDVDIDINAACSTAAAGGHAGDPVADGRATAAAGAAGAGPAAVQPPAHAPQGLCEESARFYTACILMGLTWLHSRRILHRDVKPCNLLLFSDGYLKLADLGCCCLLPPGIDSARTRTGTQAYMAPEVANANSGAQASDGYSFPVDMWSLGVTLWQMVAGSLPDWAEAQQQHNHHHHHYHHQHQQQQQQNAEQQQQQQGADQQQQQGADQQQQQQEGGSYCVEDDVVLPLEPATAHHTTPKVLEFPPQFSKELCDLLTGLLQPDSTARLSIPEVQAASWFEGFDWSALSDKTLPPPVLPAHALQCVSEVQQ